MQSESSQHPSQWSSSLPPRQNPPVESFIGSFVTLTSNYGLRYEGLLYHLNLHDSTLGLQNVICYGNGFQILPSNEVFSYIVFSLTEIKDILVKPPMSFTRRLARKATSGSKLSHASKPPLPLILSSSNPHGAKIRQKVPLISSEKLDKPQATTGSDHRIHIASNPLAQPQFPGSNFYHPWPNHVYQSMPYGNGVLYQAPINAANLPESFASERATNRLESFFTTFPPVPISLGRISGGFEFEAVNKNFKQYELWKPPTNSDQTAYTIDGSSYKISRNPFEPIGRPWNPFGPIVRPVKHTKVMSNSLQRRHQLQPPPPNFRGGYIYNTPF